MAGLTEPAHVHFLLPNPGENKLLPVALDVEGLPLSEHERLKDIVEEYRGGGGTDDRYVVLKPTFHFVGIPELQLEI